MDPFCYGSYYRFREVGPDSGEQGPEIEAVLDTAEALGAKRVRLWAGEMDYQDADRAHIEAVANKARNIAEMASKRGLAIDLEFHRRTLNNSPGNSLELLKEINHTNVHTLWQPALGISSTERLEGLKLLLPQVSNIHCFHWGAEGIQDRRALAEGEAEWRAYLDVLKAPDKPRWISLEFVKDDSIESLVRDSQCLDTLLKQGSAG
jgi:sugar phosphate isomerase/epimerase